jgi:hypothetical protein
LHLSSAQHRANRLLRTHSGSDRNHPLPEGVQSELIATPQFGVGEHPGNRLPHSIN